MFRNKELIIFDLDGTLIDSAPDLAAAVNYMLTSFNKSTFDEAVIHEWVGNGAQTLVKRALSGSVAVDEALDTSLVNEALEVFLNYYTENVCVKTCLYPNVAKTLKSLHAKNYRLAIVTNKPFAFVEPILKGLAVDNFFEYHIGGDSLSVKKPDPEPLLHVAKTLNVAIEKCVMVGDSRNDILAAKAANIESVGVTYGYNYGESIANHEPTFVVNDFLEISVLLA